MSAPPDAPDVDAIDAPPAAVFCDPADVNLVGCWDFEGNVLDHSSYANTTASSGIQLVAGKVGMGVEVDRTSRLAVAESASLDVQRLTLELWVYPRALPGATERMGLIDNNFQYGLFIFPGEVRCSALPTIVSLPVIAIDRWTHLACVFDGVTLRAYIDGLEIASATSTGPLDTNGTDGTAVGSNSPSGDAFVGVIDQLRIFRVARTPSQICAAAAAASCP